VEIVSHRSDRSALGAAAQIQASIRTLGARSQWRAGAVAANASMLTKPAWAALSPASNLPASGMMIEATASRKI
jgi:hypothetical protein